jgi:lipopolysaccharide export system protein LptA
VTVYLRFLLLSLMMSLAAPVMAQGTKVAFGSLQHDTSQPVEATSDALEVDQTTGTAIFTGNVVIGQGEMRLSAPKVLIVYLEGQTGIERMEATGGVTLVSGPDAAEADRADYNIIDGVITLTGNVFLDQGVNALNSDRMQVQLEDGTAQMSGNVRTIIQSGNN